MVAPQFFTPGPSSSISQRGRSGPLPSLRLLCCCCCCEARLLLMEERRLVLALAAGAGSAASARVGCRLSSWSGGADGGRGRGGVHLGHRRGQHRHAVPRLRPGGGAQRSQRPAVAGIQMNQISALGLSTQRSTFITWNKKTGKPFHNFISWQDVRAGELTKSWNRSLLMKTVRGISSLLHFFTRSSLFLLASCLSFTTQHISLRLAWVLQHIAEVEQAIKEDNCCFGTVDTWLLYKLTKGSVYATEYSNASSTGFFDPFKLQWSTFLSNLLSIPVSIFPPVEDTSHNFGSVDGEIFGVPIKITALVADQQAAMFGQCCFDIGDLKVTMGTGSFWDINTGSKVHTSKKDLFASADETSKMAHSLVNSGGVCFVPSFSGLQIPVNDPYACTSFMGITASTTRKHLVRAMLESIAFRNKQLYDTITRDVSILPTSIRADGGVSKNNFVMQMTSDLINKKINRPVSTDMSCLGAAFLAGLAVGFWNDKEQLKKLRRTEMVFKPQKEPKEYEPAMSNWIKAVHRSLSWYSQTSHDEITAKL
ncbi:putative glycerol kinase 5 isoform X2 [Sceloporus undulatus]|uniref:putative glycerol kinase 5 isoform X2 n=1 Tax=Sceloporus undulatus TaxID=8520 RepID=UPI001C4D039D|nr:putative glycerol kinase 5 isoform X2 [Sceloporus undulatus]